MDVENQPVATNKPAFERSELIDYGEASEITQGPTSSSQTTDGDYTS